MVNTTTKLGGDANNVTVCKVAHGLMMMTWTPKPVSDEQAFEAIKAGLDALPPNTKMVLNSGEFYGMEPRTANLELIARFFEKYPTYTDKAFLSVKGGTKADDLEPDSSPENLKRSVDEILKKLRGTKKLDLFECARVAPNNSIEETIKILSGFVKEGKFDHIGMSECKASTLRRGNAIHPITAVEIEISPWSYGDEVKEVVATATELGISVIAYSPLGRGFLVGKYKKPEDVEDFRKGMSRFQEENFYHNLALVDSIKKVATAKNVTPAQLCIAWVAALGPNVIPLPGSSHKTRTMENLSAADVVLSEADVKDINDAIAAHTVKGDRYFGNDAAAHLWG